MHQSRLARVAALAPLLLILIAVVVVARIDHPVEEIEVAAAAEPPPPPTTAVTAPVAQQIRWSGVEAAAATTTTTTEPPPPPTTAPPTTPYVPPTTRYTPPTTRYTPPPTQPAYGGSAPNAFLACVRQRESGGNYQAYNPSGAAGAYQFMPGTWASLNTGYSSPLNAPPSVQDAAAAQLYARAGRGPWEGPGC